MVNAVKEAAKADRRRGPVRTSERGLVRALETGPTRDFLNRLWASMPKDVLHCTEGMQIGEQSKYLSWQVPKTFETLELLQITDLQFGQVHCKVHRIIEYRDWVLAAPNRFMLWTGDMVDAWAMWSPGTPWDQLGDPQSQIAKFCELWAPARHRVVGNIGGNHERRALPGFGDLGTLIAMFLKLPYSNGRQMIDFYFGQHQPFKVSLWHGKGSARTKGAVAQNLDRFMQIGDSQLFLMGHSPHPMTISQWREIREPGSRTIRLQKIMGGIGSSFLETWGTYGEVAGFNSHDVIMPRAILERDGHWELTLR